MNVLFFLLPKASCAFINETDTLRQVLEKMEHHHYTAIPLLSKEGKYLGIISEGDLLYYFKNNNVSKESLNQINIKNVKITKEIKAITINNSIESLVELIINQNFVPVIDDSKTFIGIITRKKVIEYLVKKYSLH
jgi:CBS domain-containing protein